jgi:hypothetical protein
LALKGKSHHHSGLTKDVIDVVGVIGTLKALSEIQNGHFASTGYGAYQKTLPGAFQLV